MTRSEDITDGPIPVTSYRWTTAFGVRGIAVLLSVLLFGSLLLRIVFEQLGVDPLFALFFGLVIAFITASSVVAAMIRLRAPRPMIDDVGQALHLGGKRISFAEITHAKFQVGGRRRPTIMLTLGRERGPQALVPILRRSGELVSASDRILLTDVIDGSSIPTEIAPPSPGALPVRQQWVETDRHVALSLIRSPETADDLLRSRYPSVYF